MHVAMLWTMEPKPNFGRVLIRHPGVEGVIHHEQAQLVERVWTGSQELTQTWYELECIYSISSA